MSCCERLQVANSMQRCVFEEFANDLQTCEKLRISETAIRFMNQLRTFVVDQLRCWMLSFLVPSVFFEVTEERLNSDRSCVPGDSAEGERARHSGRGETCD